MNLDFIFDQTTPSQWRSRPLPHTSGEHHRKRFLLVLHNTNSVFFFFFFFSSAAGRRSWHLLWGGGGWIIAERRCLGRSHQLFMRPFCTCGASCQRECDRWRDNMVLQNTIRLIGPVSVFLLTSNEDGDLDWKGLMLLIIFFFVYKAENSSRLHCKMAEIFFLLLLLPGTRETEWSKDVTFNGSLSWVAIELVACPGCSLSCVLGQKNRCEAGRRWTGCTWQKKMPFVNWRTGGVAWLLSESLGFQVASDHVGRESALT